ncbi:MAG: caspase family protein, partial [Burkholderiaceae bacterium]|nr:caspase family protein [Burkholderiaceae bacterium]
MTLSTLAARTAGALLTLFALAGGTAAQAPATPAAGDVQLRIESGQHAGVVRRLALSPDERRLVTVGDDKTARLWSVPEQSLLAVLRVPIGAGEAGRLYGAAFSPDGREIVVGGSLAGSPGGSRLYFFDAASGRALRSVAIAAGDVKRLVWLKSPEAIAACSASPALLTLVSRDGRALFTDRFEAPCYGLAAHPDGSLLVATFDGRVRRYAARDRGSWQAAGGFATEIRDPQSLAVSPDGRHVAVGYFSRLDARSVAVDVFELAASSLAKRFVFTDLTVGNLMSVAWSRDGTSIAAAGTGFNPPGFKMPMKRIAWPGGETRDAIVANDSVFDIAATSSGDLVLASGDGAWTIAPATGEPRRAQSAWPDLRGADHLKLSADARSVAFSIGPGEPAQRFDIRRRLLGPDAGSDLAAPRHSAFSFSVRDWEDNLRPQVAGQALAMEPAEVSRAVALATDNSAAFVGTTRSLRRIERDGTQRWSVRTAAEVRAVNVGADGRVVVTAMGDGTLAWWRAADGLPLMQAFATRDGRWIVWTSRGHYDASVGAESLIGWHVNRPGGADFHSIGKFRSAYHRPDVIDRVLDTLDPELALSQADDARRVAAQKVLDDDLRQRIQAVAAAPPPPPEKVLPPVLTVLGERAVRRTSTELRLEFAVRAERQPADSILVRVDGRPIEGARVTLPARQDGQSTGSVVVRMPPRDAEVVLFAVAGTLVSEPTQVSFRYEPPLPATPGKAPPVTAGKAPPPSSGASPSAAAPGGAAAGAPTGSAPAAATGAKRLFVVSVGVSEYARSDYNLRLPAKDAGDFLELMKTQAGTLYSTVEGRLLINGDATRARVLEAMNWLRSVVGPQDTGMLFIAGHGVNDAIGQYHFLPHDADVARPSRTAVPESAIRQALSSLKGRAVLFVDTCFAGNVIGSGAAA